jgi:hypothetical protein
LRWLRNVQNRIVYIVYGWVYVKSQLRDSKPQNRELVILNTV